MKIKASVNPGAEEHPSFKIINGSLSQPVMQLLQNV